VFSPSTCLFSLAAEITTGPEHYLIWSWISADIPWHVNCISNSRVIKPFFKVHINLTSGEDIHRTSDSGCHWNSYQSLGAHTVGTGLFIQWINSEYMENKFKIPSNTNSLIIFWIYWNQNVADTCQLPPAISIRSIYFTVRSERSKKGTMVALYYSSVTPRPPKKSAWCPAWSSLRSPCELYGNPNKLILMCSC